jgi:cobalt-zinc-cadmium efflux system protein
MAHDHAHQHTIDPVNLNTAFIAGIALNLAFVIVEVVMGFSVHSLSLLSDAGHNLADTGALALSLFAFRLLKVKSNEQYTYGYRKTSILVALLNAVILLISIGIIAYEGVQRLFHPVPVSGINISVVAGIGIIINFLSARLFLKNKEDDINVKSAYLHLMSDAAVSAGIVAGGILMFYFKWFWLDPLLSIVIALVIVISTWKLLKESLRLSLDGVPKNISIADIKATAMKVEGVKYLHHIHIWAISTTENALTAQLVLETNITQQQEKKIKQELRHQLEHKNIQHVTLETDREDEFPEKELC